MRRVYLRIVTLLVQVQQYSTASLGFGRFSRSESRKHKLQKKIGQSRAMVRTQGPWSLSVSVSVSVGNIETHCLIDPRPWPSPTKNSGKVPGGSLRDAP